jgi:type VI secretion system secreted protein Hcp
VAQRGYAAITLTGSGITLEGEHDVVAFGGVDVSQGHIEVYQVSWGTNVRLTSVSTTTTGRRTVDPVRFLKRVDRTTPLLYQALVQNQNVEAEIKLFAENPVNGSIEHFFTVHVDPGRLVSIQSTNPSVFDATNDPLPVYEVVELQPRRIRYIDIRSGTEFEDQVGSP